MLAKSDLRKISKARLSDAAALRRARKYDGAVYLCGYAVEIALKARICRTLRWSGWPDSKGEWACCASLKTHSLDVLLRFSGVEDRIKTDFFAEWSAVAQWDPETRYKAVGHATKEDALLMIASARRLVRIL